MVPTASSFVEDIGSDQCVHAIASGGSLHIDDHDIHGGRV
jgi:hypothetical protein